MKRIIMKVICCAVGASMLSGLIGCGGVAPQSADAGTGTGTGTGAGTETQAATTEAATDAASHTTTQPDGTRSLTSNRFRLDFPRREGGFVVSVVDNADGSAAFTGETPAALQIRAASRKEYACAGLYETVDEIDEGFVCAATVTTDGGSRIRFEDTYSLLDEDAFKVSRTVTVVFADGGDAGFRSLFSLKANEENASAKSYELFIPSILYKDTRNMVAGSAASDASAARVYVKETRTGLPLVMARSKKSGASVAIAHLHPAITVDGILGGGANDEINERLQYGSIGYTSNGGLSVDFCYPSLETPTVYYTAYTSRAISHPVRDGVSHTYDISIIPAKEDAYAKAMTLTFKKAYLAESPKIADDIDIDKVYDDNVSLFKRTFREFGTGSVTAAGVPWSIDLRTGNVVEYTFQMGFVGQQTSVGYLLMKSGYEKDDMTMIKQGRAIIDFWTSDSIMKDRLPIVWWDPANDSAGGRTRGYPSFLRCFIDGMEGILDAYKLAREHGDEDDAWLCVLEKVADFLVDEQNKDGSFFRAYNTNGTVCTDTYDPNIQGDSRFNTSVAIRFLSRMYELTGIESYRKAAIDAADYCYSILYRYLEKYVGGTPDNANTVDKEAAIYAMYGFNAAYELTGSRKYLEAAEHAAVSAMSWVYCYDFACPSSAENDAINPFADGGVSGFSIIATGHSGADNYSAFMYYEMFKLYVYTGDEFYLEAAKFLQSNTKLSTDYNGQMGWKYSALGPEATNVSDFDFGTVGVWLPWSGVANILPAAYMRDTFGSADISKLPADIPTLRSALEG